MAREVEAVVLTPQSNEDVQQMVRSHAHVRIRGGGTKTALSRSTDDATLLATGQLAGILEYEPGEFTFTARAGTPLTEITRALDAHGQYLPFDPPLVARGATLGGTIAAGLSGSGRQRYGGVRDFLIGVRFVDGQGQLVRGGGKVVKNAAGFDLPKLMIGSVGRLGVIVEASFKVFPRPPQYGTLRCTHATLAAALEQVARLNRSTFDIEALDIAVEDGRPVSYVRQGGLAATLPARQATLRTWLGGGEVLTGEEDAVHWQRASEFAWAPSASALVKIPVTLAAISPLDEYLAAAGASRRYCAAGNLAWVAWPHDLAELDGQLTQRGLSGLAVLGEAEWPFLGARTGASVAARIKAVLDPHNRLPAL